MTRFESPAPCGIRPFRRAGPVLAAISALFLAVPAFAAAPPNILLVIADDMGLDASPCYPIGADKPRMAFLETMCAEGLVFEQAYAAPTCSPTRATILTGRYGFRTGIGTVVKPSDVALRDSEMTLFEYLDANAPAPYSHAVIGKWHLASRQNGYADNPDRAGVGYYAGVISGAIEDYYNWPRTHEGRTEAVEGYITSALTDEAIAWAGAQDGPWFLWLAHVAPHTPFHVPPEALLQGDVPAGSRKDMRQNPRDYYFAALEALDSELSRFVASLDQTTRDNLVIVFIGDNGSPNRVVQDPYDRSHAKGTLWQGGVHVPLIVWGKGVARGGERETALVNTTDLFATIAELAGVDSAVPLPEDSISFAPLLGVAGPAARDYAYVEHFGEAAGPGGAMQFGWGVTDGRYKLLAAEGVDEQLFDLTADEGEQNDLLSGGNLAAEAAAAWMRLGDHVAALKQP